MISGYIVEPEIAAVELRPGGRLALHGGRYLHPPLIHLREVHPSDCMTRAAWIYGVDVHTGASVVEYVEVRRID